VIKERRRRGSEIRTVGEVKRAPVWGGKMKVAPNGGMCYFSGKVGLIPRSDKLKGGPKRK